MVEGTGSFVGLEADGELLVSRHHQDLIAASIYDKYSAGPSIRPIFTRCYFTRTNMVPLSPSIYDK